MGWKECSKMDEKLTGDHGRSRTCDLEFRKLLLYPSELRGPDFSPKNNQRTSNKDEPPQKQLFS